MNEITEYRIEQLRELVGDMQILADGILTNVSGTLGNQFVSRMIGSFAETLCEIVNEIEGDFRD